MEKELIKLLAEIEDHLAMCPMFGTREEKMMEKIKRLKIKLAQLVSAE